MRWESKVLSANQMLSSSLCFFKTIPSPWPSWIFLLPAALISLVFATYLVSGFGFLSVFLCTSLVLVFSTIFCSCTALNHHKAVCVVGETKSSMEESSDHREVNAEAKDEEEELDGNDGDEERTSYYAEESSDKREDIAEAKEEEEDNDCEEKKSYYAEESSDQRKDVTETKEEEEDNEDNNGGGSDVNNNSYSNRSPDSLTNCESHHQEMLTSEESDEHDDYWPLDQSIDGSDGAISDEESLIEIALPTGHCSLKHHYQQQQQSLMMMSELLAEYNFDMNEEDNLIEIDISMGSIKSYSSRFEIQA